MKSNFQRRQDAKKQIFDKYDYKHDWDYYRFTPRKINSTSGWKA